MHTWGGWRTTQTAPMPAVASMAPPAQAHQGRKATQWLRTQLPINDVCWAAGLLALADMHGSFQHPFSTPESPLTGVLLKSRWPVTANTAFNLDAAAEMVAWLRDFHLDAAAAIAASNNLQSGCRFRDGCNRKMPLPKNGCSRFNAAASK